MTAVEFTVPGKPTTWARAGSRGAQRFTPKPQREAKARVAEAALEAVGPEVPYPRGVALEARLSFVYARPKKPTYPSPQGRPDIDNLTKLVLDALNGVAYADDAQVIRLTATKRYGDQGETVVQLVPLEDDQCS